MPEEEIQDIRMADEHRTPPEISTAIKAMALLASPGAAKRAYLQTQAPVNSAQMALLYHPRRGCQGLFHRSWLFEAHLHKSLYTTADAPPSTLMAEPVTKEPRSEARKAITLAASSASPMRPSGFRAPISLKAASSDRLG